MGGSPGGMPLGGLEMGGGPDFGGFGGPDLSGLGLAGGNMAPGMLPPEAPPIQPFGPGDMQRRNPNVASYWPRNYRPGGRGMAPWGYQVPRPEMPIPESPNIQFPTPGVIGEGQGVNRGVRRRMRRRIRRRMSQGGGGGGEGRY